MKNLNISEICPKPFNTISIDKNGNCFACECSGWLPVPIGNIQLQTIEEIIESPKLKNIQDTVSNKTYFYCKETLCSYLLDKRKETWNFLLSRPKTKLKYLRLGIDDSCNLSCPSCRRFTIFEKRGIKLNSRLRMMDKVIAFLEKTDYPIMIHLGSDGDPFASLVYRYFLKNCPINENIKFSIQTNGLLLRKMYNKNQNLFDNLTTLGLSIDGCKKNSYEKLRRGGNFETLKKNLEFISFVKSKHNFILQFHCVVQKDNYKEMKKYVEFAQNYKADKVWFNRLVDWKTMSNFDEHDVVDPKNNRHADFKKHLVELTPYLYKNGERFVEFPTLDI